jgi:hypothetical protein
MGAKSTASGRLKVNLFLSGKRGGKSHFFFFGWCYSYGPQQGPDRQQKKKRRESSSRGESKRKLLKETQNQRKETRKKKKPK